MAVGAAFPTRNRQRPRDATLIRKLPRLSVCPVMGIDPWRKSGQASSIFADLSGLAPSRIVPYIWPADTVPGSSRRTLRLAIATDLMSLLPSVRGSVLVRHTYDTRWLCSPWAQRAPVGGVVAMAAVRN